MSEAKLYSADDETIEVIHLFDVLKIDRWGVEYKGRRIEDAGEVYWALREVLERFGRMNGNEKS